IIEHEGAVLVLLHELKGELLGHIRPEAAWVLLPSAIADENRVPVAALNVLDEGGGFIRILAGDGLPETLQVRALDLFWLQAAGPGKLLVKAMPREHLRFIVKVVHLPLAAEAGGVSGLPEQPGE